MQAAEEEAQVKAAWEALAKAADEEAQAEAAEEAQAMAAAGEAEKAEARAAWAAGSTAGGQARAKRVAPQRDHEKSLGFGVTLIKLIKLFKFLK